MKSLKLVLNNFEISLNEGKEEESLLFCFFEFSKEKSEIDRFGQFWTCQKNRNSFFQNLSKSINNRNQNSKLKIIIKNNFILDSNYFTKKSFHFRKNNQQQFLVLISQPLSKN